MDGCPVCMESFDQDQHIPKSLDCRHAVCAECLLHPRGPPLRKCPLCNRDIKNRSAVPNDLSIIAYLEKNQCEQYLKEQREKVKDIIERVQEASGDVDKRLKGEKASADKTLEGIRTIFNSHLKDLFEMCQQRCNSKPFLSDTATQNLRQLEDSLQELQVSMAACRSLLDNPHVTPDDIDRCGSEVQNVVTKARDIGESRATETATWNTYTLLVMEAFAEVSKLPPGNDSSSVPGNKV